MNAQKLAEARRLAAMASDPVKVVSGLTSAAVSLADGSLWETRGETVARLIIPPRIIGGRWLAKRDYDAIERRRRELAAPAQEAA